MTQVNIATYLLTIALLTLIIIRIWRSRNGYKQIAEDTIHEMKQLQEKFDVKIKEKNSLLLKLDMENRSQLALIDSMMKELEKQHEPQ